MKRARELEPFSAIISTGLGEIYFDMHQYAEAERLCLTTIEMHPDFSQAHADLGATYALQNRFPDAIREIRKAI